MEDDLLGKATELFRRGKREVVMRDFESAENTLSAATDMLENQFTADHPQVDEARALLVDTKELLADSCFAQQKLAFSAQIYQWLVEGSSFRDTVSKVRLRYKLAKTLEQQFKKSEALAIYEEAADLCERKMPEGTLVGALILESYFKLLKEDRRPSTFVTMIADKAQRARAAVTPAPDDGALSLFGKTQVTQEVQVLKHQLESIKNIPEAPVKTSSLQAIVRIALSAVVLVGVGLWLSRLNTNLALAPAGGTAATLNGQTFQCPGVDGTISFGEPGHATLTVENQQHRLHSRNSGDLADLLQTLLHGSANEWWVSPQDQYFFDGESGQIFYASTAPDLLLYNQMKEVSDKVTKEQEVEELTYENPFSHEQSKLDPQAQRSPAQFIDLDQKLLRISGVGDQPLPLAIALYGYSDPAEMVYSSGKEFDSDVGDLFASFPADQDKLKALRAMTLKSVLNVEKTWNTPRVHHIPGSIAFGNEDTTIGYGSDGQQLPYFIVKGVKEWKWHGPIRHLRYNDPTSSADFIIVQAGGTVPNVLPDRKEIVISNWSRAQIADATARRRYTPVWFYLSFASLFVYFLLAYRTNDLFNHGFFSTLVLVCGCASSLTLQPVAQYLMYGAIASAVLWTTLWFKKAQA